jgi:rubrerythrin
LIGYGRAIKFQLDELKKVLEEIAEDEAEHDKTYVKEESKAK